MYIDNDKIIDESLDIMKWALSQLESNWYLAYQEEQDEMIKHNDTVFKGWLDKYKYHDRYPEYSRNYYRNKCTETLSKYDLKLTFNPYLMVKIHLVDAAIFPFIRQCANVDRVVFHNISQCRNLVRALDYIKYFSINYAKTRCMEKG